MERVPLNVHTANCVTVHDVIAINTQTLLQHMVCINVLGFLIVSLQFTLWLLAKGFKVTGIWLAPFSGGRGSRLPLGLT